MKGYFSKLLIFVISLFFLSACSDNIVYVPYEWPAADTLYTKDPDKLIGLLTDAYGSVPDMPLYEEKATDDAVSNSSTDVFSAMVQGDWTPGNTPLSAWDCYDAIDKATQVIYYVDRVEWGDSDRVNELKRKIYKGQAIALRAYFYTRLLMMHSGYSPSGDLLAVPMDLTLSSSPKAAKKGKRVPLFAAVDTLLKEYDKAIVLLPFAYEDRYKINESGKTELDGAYNALCGSEKRNTLSGKAALALKARLALYAASPAFNNGIYNQALCDSVVQYTGYLIDEIGGLSTLESGGKLSDALYYLSSSISSNQELIWGKQAINNVLEKKVYPPTLLGNGDVNPTHNLVACFPMKNGYPIDVAASGFSATDPYKERDPRLSNYVLFHKGEMNHRIISMVNTNDAMGKAGATATNYYLKKGIRPELQLQNNDVRIRVFALIRYSEVFLMYAEAMNALAGADGKGHNYVYSAKEVINALRTRVGITSTDYVNSLSGDAFTNLVRTERRIELCFEGFRFWDLRRWNLSLTEGAKAIRIQENNGVCNYRDIPAEARKFEDYMRFAPIPEAARAQNSQVVQNQGY